MPAGTNAVLGETEQLATVALLETPGPTMVQELTPVAEYEIVTGSPAWMRAGVAEIVGVGFEHAAAPTVTLCTGHEPPAPEHERV